MTYNLIDKLKETKKFINNSITTKPEIGIVLGSGLSELADAVIDSVRIPYIEIPHFVRSTVEGHKGDLVVGKLSDKNVVIMCGRMHFYEGYTMQEITYPIRLLALLGVKILILTSAVGAINKKYKPGDLVLITDHINFIGDNPLRGEHCCEFGERFPDMSQVYDKKLANIAEKIAKKHKLTIHRGVYIACRGPSYETPKEINMFRKLGADVVGMSVVPEAIVAHQMGIKLICISYVSNMAAGVSNRPLSHKEVIETGKKINKKLAEFVQFLLKSI